MTHPLRVTHVIGGLELGGAETLLYRLATYELPGIEQQVICLGRPDWYSSRLAERGITVHHLGATSPLSLPFALRDLGKALRQAGADLVQSWMYLSNMLSASVARRSSIPVVWGIHNSSFERVGLPSRIAAFVGGVRAPQLADFVINCSRHSADLHSRLGYSAAPNAVIPNGYDPAEFRPDPNARARTRQALGLDEETFLVGSISRWHAHKDVPNLLQAIRIASNAGVPLRCLLIGRGLGSDNPELIRAIEDALCTELVLPLGTRSDIPDLAAGFDLHVLSSSSEAFPNVVAETMLSGTPNVVTDTGDSAEIVRGYGWKVPPRSSQELADAITEAWRERSTEPNKWEVRCAEARRHIAENFTFDRMAQAYADVWRKVASDRG
jgi:glycosyltransferase involved in cell wall biosynthesis